MAKAWLVPGQTDREVVGGRQRGQVEVDRGVAGAFLVVGVGLELGVVGRGDHQRAGAG